MSKPTGGARPNAGRHPLPRLTAEQARNALRAHHPDETAVAIAAHAGAHPKAIQAAFREGATVRQVQKWTTAILSKLSS